MFEKVQFPNWATRSRQKKHLNELRVKIQNLNAIWNPWRFGAVGPDWVGVTTCVFGEVFYGRVRVDVELAAQRPLLGAVHACYENVLRIFELRREFSPVRFHGLGGEWEEREIKRYCVMLCSVVSDVM